MKPTHHIGLGFAKPVPTSPAVPDGMREDVQNALQDLTRQGVKKETAWQQVKKRPEFAAYFAGPQEQRRQPVPEGMREDVESAVSELMDKDGMSRADAWQAVKRREEFNAYFGTDPARESAVNAEDMEGGRADLAQEERAAALSAVDEVMKNRSMTFAAAWQEVKRRGGFPNFFGAAGA